MASISSNEHRQIIVEYWARILLSTSFSINDIAKIILEFGDQYEKFDPSISVEAVRFADDDLTTFFNEDDDIYYSQSSFGLIDAIPGYQYHWKVKIASYDYRGNIGIIQADKCKVIRDNVTEYWWNKPYGYSYYSDGSFWHYSHEQEYGVSLREGDIIEICLDLKDKDELSYIVNGKAFGIADNVKRGHTYKLAIGLYSGRVTLIS